MPKKSADASICSSVVVLLCLPSKQSLLYSFQFCNAQFCHGLSSATLLSQEEESAVDLREHKGHRIFRLTVRCLGPNQSEVKIPYKMLAREQVESEAFRIRKLGQTEWTGLQASTFQDLKALASAEGWLPVRPGRASKEKWIGYIVLGRMRKAAETLAPKEAKTSEKDPALLCASKVEGQIGQILKESEHGPNAMVTTSVSCKNGKDVTDFWLDASKVEKSKVSLRKEQKEKFLSESEHGVLPSIILDKYHMMMEVDDEAVAFLFGTQRAFGRKAEQVHRTIFNKVVAGPWELFQRHPLVESPAGVLYNSSDKGVKHGTIADILHRFQNAESPLLLVQVSKPEPHEELHNSICPHFAEFQADGKSWSTTMQACSVHVATSGKYATVDSFLYLPDKMLG